MITKTHNIYRHFKQLQNAISWLQRDIKQLSKDRKLLQRDRIGPHRDTRYLQTFQMTTKMKILYICTMKSNSLLLVSIWCSCSSGDVRLQTHMARRRGDSIPAVHHLVDTHIQRQQKRWEPTVRIQVGRCVWASGLCLFLCSWLLFFCFFFLFVAAARLVGGDRSYNVIMEIDEDKTRYRYWILSCLCFLFD